MTTTSTQTEAASTAPKRSVRERNYEEARNWILRRTTREPSDIGVRACVLLALWNQGFHNIPEGAEMNWHNTQGITAYVRPGMSTVDRWDLTELVFLAHDEALRVEIQSSAAEPGIRIFITARQRSGEFWETHPTLEDAVAKHRKTFPESGVLK